MTRTSVHWFSSSAGFAVCFVFNFLFKKWFPCDYLRSTLPFGLVTYAVRLSWNAIWLNFFKNIKKSEWKVRFLFCFLRRRSSSSDVRDESTVQQSRQGPPAARSGPSGAHQLVEPGIESACSCWGVERVRPGEWNGAFNGVWNAIKVGTWNWLSWFEWCERCGRFGDDCDCVCWQVADEAAEAAEAADERPARSSMRRMVRFRMSAAVVDPDGARATPSTSSGAESPGNSPGNSAVLRRHGTANHPGSRLYEKKT